MHSTVAPGVYVVGGTSITDESDCTTLVACSLTDPPTCALIGCGSGRSLHALVRNLMELGISIKHVRYAIIPLVLDCVASGCRYLKEAFRWILLCAPPSIARMLREGASGTPIPISMEASEVPLDDDVKIHVKVLDPRSKALITVSRRGRALSMLLMSSSIEAIEDLEAKGVNRIICLLEEPTCRRLGGFR